VAIVCFSVCFFFSLDQHAAVRTTNENYIKKNPNKWVTKTFWQNTNKQTNQRKKKGNQQETSIFMGTANWLL